MHFFDTILKQFDGRELSGVAYKDFNRKRKIIASLNTREDIAINEISELLNISFPKTTVLVNELIQEGFVKEVGKRSDGPGRKAAYYSLAAAPCYFLGVEIRKYKMSIGLMAFDKSMVASKLDIAFPFSDTKQALQHIVEQIKDFLDSVEVPREKIAGLGLSIAGRINVKTGEILSVYHFVDEPLKATLEEAFGLPVLVDNDSRCLAYGQFHFGCQGPENNVLILNLDYGIGLGIFVDKKPVYGASGYAGELGHVPIFDNEKICYCGKKGCLETEVSGMALIRFITEKMKEGISSSLQKVLADKTYLELEDVARAVQKGDSLAITSVAHIAGKLGKGLAVAINLFNPELIVVSGTMAAFGDSLLLPAKSAILQYSLNVISNDARLELSSMNDKAGLPGTCLLVRDKMLGMV